jgi:hypothetical protein
MGLLKKLRKGTLRHRMTKNYPHEPKSLFTKLRLSEENRELSKSLKHIQPTSSKIRVPPSLKKSLVSKLKSPAGILGAVALLGALGYGAHSLLKEDLSGYHSKSTPPRKGLLDKKK